MFVTKCYRDKIYSFVKLFFVSVTLLIHYLNPTLLLDFVIMHVVSHPPDSLCVYVVSSCPLIQRFPYLASKVFPQLTGTLFQNDLILL